MLRDYKTVVAIGHVIELAVAPVFLLTAVGTMLSVMTSRLARIIDRARYHEAKLENAPPEKVAIIHAYLAVLARRADLIGHAIFLSTSTALLVCAVIALLFLGDYLRYDVSLPIATLFIFAMLLLVSGLICFLREVFIAKGSLHIGPDRQLRGKSGPSH